LIILVGLVCLVGLPGGNILADNSGEAPASVTVLPPVSVTVTPYNKVVPVSNKTYQFTANATYSNGTNADVTAHAVWASSDNAVATIDSSGLATLLSNGITTISASFSGVPGSTLLRVSGSGSGDNGGGGGGGGGSGDTTSLSGYMTEDGKLIIEVEVKSNDGKVIIFLPKNTIARFENGQKLRYISIKEETEYPSPSDSRKILGLVYDIGPDDATFSPPVYLTFVYSDSQITADIVEQKMVIATLQEGQWVEIERCSIDPVANTVTILTNHLTVYTLMARIAPASFEFTDINITPSEVYVDETVTISVNVANTGDLSGSCDVVLKINGIALQSEEVTLDSGASRMISFTVTPDVSGWYTVAVNGLSRQFKVNSPGTEAEGTVAEATELPTLAELAITDFSITPHEINTSEEVTISATITNIGSSGGNYTVILKIDDEEEDRKEISLASGESKSLSFSTSLDTVGSHTIDIGGSTGQLIVKSPSSLTASATTLPEQPSMNWMPLLGIFAGLLFIVVILIIVLKKFYGSQ
jgi:hypothetical protein